MSWSVTWKKTGHPAHAHMNHAAERENAVNVWHIIEARNRYQVVFSQRKVNAHTTVPMQNLSRKIDKRL